MNPAEGREPLPERPDALLRPEGREAGSLPGVTPAGEAVTVDHHPAAAAGPPGDGRATAAPGADPAAPELPRRAGRYHVQAQLGRGGMGAVLRVRDSDLGRTLAVKILLPRAAASPGAADRFLEEARLTGRLQHPGIPPVHELGRLEDGRPFFAMKLIAGRTLAELLQERGAGPGAPAPDSRLLGIFRQVCQTIAYAHSQGIIHRDLKPANVMVGAFGEVQVMDWGLAKALDRGEGRATPSDEGAAAEADDLPAGQAAALTRAGTVLGTPAYMAPEQARGEVDRLDERCDVFGLGALLCEILTGRPPFGEGGAADRQRRAAAGDVAGAWSRLDEAATRADPELVALARRCLAPRAEDRPRHAGELAEAVERYEQRVQERLRTAELEREKALVQAAEEGKRRRVERQKQRARLAAVAAGVLLLAGLAGAGSWYLQHQARLEDEEQQRQALREAHIRQALEQAGRSRQELHQRLAEKGGVFGLLNRPADWKYRIDLAREAWHHARKLADNPDEPVGPELREEIDALQAALDQDEAEFRVALELEEVREARSVELMEGFPNYLLNLQRYPAAFRKVGLVPRPGREAALAELVRRSPIREQLLAGLDDWAHASWWLGQPERAGLLQRVARRADPDPWRDRVRDVTLWRNQPALRRLADQALADPQALARLSPQLLDLLGIYLEAGNAREDWFRRTQALHPRDFWLNYSLGLSLQTSGKTAQAEAFVRVALTVRPDSTAARHALANVLFAQKDYPGAALHYRKLTELQPRYAAGWHGLGNALYHQKDFKAAAAAYHKVWELTPKSATLPIDLGNTYRALRDYQGAAAWYGKALELDARNVFTRIRLADCLFYQRDFAGALAHYREARALDPRSAAAWSGSGDALLARGDLAGAEAHCRNALELDPRFARAHNGLGNVCFAREDYAGAADRYGQAVELDPSYAPAWYNLGRVRQQQKDLPGAVAHYRRAVAEDPGYALAWRGLGGALNASKDYKGAAAAFQKALDLDPRAASAHLGLGTALQGQGRFEEALARFRRGLELLGRDDARRNWAQAAVELCRKLPARQRRLPGVLAGGAASPAERADLADLCVSYLGRPRDAVGLYAAAFAADPKLAEDRGQYHRYNAACAAVLAAAGVGPGADKLDDQARARLRRQALDWLRADLDACAKQVRTGQAAKARQRVDHWRHDVDLAGVRGEKRLAELPADEQEGWRRLWAEVERLLEQSRTVRAGRPSR
jgi:tetratricopeptide (TPR) repeat protein